MTQPPRSSSTGSAAGEPFLVLGENRLAFTAVERLARRTARGVASLLYLYGPPGTGKSHLVRHLLREVRQSAGAPKVQCATASGLAAEYADASERNRLPQWSEPYRTCDLLVCEDLQAIARRPETQRLLVAWIDDVVAGGGRVLLTADRLPGQISGLQPRLLSRCRGGATAGIALPGEGGRAELLGHFAAARQIALTPEARKELALARAAAPRELRALLTEADAAARLKKTRLDVAFVRQFLAGEVARPAPTLTEVARCVARHFGVRVSDLRSSTRRHDAAEPRQCAMSLARVLTGEPLAKIALFFGRKNHTAVIHACRRTAAAVEDDPALRHHLTQIRASLGHPGGEGAG